MLILSQILHIARLQGLAKVLSAGALISAPKSIKLIFNVVALGWLAGIFEKLAPYIFFKKFPKTRHSCNEGTLVDLKHAVSKRSYWVRYQLLSSPI